MYIYIYVCVCVCVYNVHIYNTLYTFMYPTTYDPYRCFAVASNFSGSTVAAYDAPMSPSLGCI